MSISNNDTILESFTKDKTYQIQIFSFSIQNLVSFPAFITGFTDSYTSEWRKESVYGRMDPISTFKATTRKINVTFDVPCYSPENASNNLKDIDTIIKGLYPIYDNGQYGTAIISSPPMFRVRFANLIKNSNQENDEYNVLVKKQTKTINTLRSGLLCYIESFDFAPKTENGFFIDKGNVYPKLISVALNLNIIHEHALGNYPSSANNLVSIRPRSTFENFPHGSQADAPTYEEDNDPALQQADNARRESQKRAEEETILSAASKINSQRVAEKAAEVARRAANRSAPERARGRGDVLPDDSI